MSSTSNAPRIGQFQIGRGSADVTDFGVIRPGDVVTGAWTRMISRQIVSGRPLKPGERFRYQMYGRVYDSDDHPGCWKLQGCDRFEKKRPVAGDEFRRIWEEIGTVGKQKVYRKSVARWCLPYSRAILPELRLEPSGGIPHTFGDGDLLYAQDDGTFGFWPEQWAKRFVEPIVDETAQLAPIADQLDKASTLFDHCAQAAEGCGLRILRSGRDVTADGVILTGDTVKAPWRATKSNSDLCTARRLSCDEQVIGMTPWDAMLDSGTDGNCYELWPVSDPTDWRIITHRDLHHRYLLAGCWGETRCYRQRVGTIAFQVTPEMGVVRVQSKEDREPKPIGEQWYVVYDGSGGYYHWSPETAAKRQWVG